MVYTQTYRPASLRNIVASSNRILVMAEAISCPHCDRKISLRAELAGQRVVCPHCKAPFVAPGFDASEDQAAAASRPAAAAAAGGGDFFADLSGAAPRTGASRSTASPSRPPARPPARATGRPTRRGAARKGPKKAPVEFYVLGGFAALIALLVVVVVAVKFSGEEAKPAANNAEGMKFGLTEPQRRQFFFKLVEAVDDFGTGDKCRAQWSELQKTYGVDDSATAKILDEGFDAGFGASFWPQPDNTTPAGKVRFKTWNAEKTQTGHYPMLNY